MAFLNVNDVRDRGPSLTLGKRGIDDVAVSVSSVMYIYGVG